MKVLDGWMENQIGLGGFKGLEMNAENGCMIKGVGDLLDQMQDPSSGHN